MNLSFPIHPQPAHHPSPAIVNIWSHLLGAAQFLVGLGQFLRLHRVATSHGAQHQSNVIALTVYYLCVVLCFLLSAAFHTFFDHSAGAHRFGNELDHLGIVLVIWGTGVSAVHFAFYCEPHLQNLYHVGLTATAIACAVFTLRPKFRLPAYRTTRFLMYCFLGSSLFVPVIHGSWRLGLSELEHRMGLSSFLGLALINFSGAALYAARVPERWFPRTFDFIGQSHNLMHILVLTGALVRLNGLLQLSQRWSSANEQCPYIR